MSEFEVYGEVDTGDKVVEKNIPTLPIPILRIFLRLCRNWGLSADIHTHSSAKISL
ncbi:MAG: hypothetical protein L6V93_05850 [Clostridiales bacterium]|nr:MAG: hypothetical protein L6V93_05850 [Clostridiales bacterium]